MIPLNDLFILLTLLGLFYAIPQLAHSSYRICPHAVFPIKLARSRSSKSGIVRLNAVTRRLYATCLAASWSRRVGGWNEALR